MTLEEYKEKYLNTDDTDFEITKELAEAWLDEKVNAVKQIAQIEKDVNYNLVGGAFDEENGDFANEVCIAGFWGDLTLHIFQGIEILARILGVSLEIKEKGYPYKYEYHFMYKGVKVFEISNDLL